MNIGVYKRITLIKIDIAFVARRYAKSFFICKSADNSAFWLGRLINDLSLEGNAVRSIRCN